ncbi:ABC transporter transmembrane domain-containing protein [Lutimaribacter marinistellae]|uniref:ABC transporter transmembrane domain-containing protein n=1 Tax=Lutimaribacter marinistellae TaxID=1820329 RepID=A0ABV7TJC9_9RHOB
MIQLYKAIWRVSWQRQIMLILLSLAIAALAAAPLEFQKRIINLLTEESLDKDLLFSLGAGMMGVILASLAFKWARGFLASVLGEDTVRLIRTRLLSEAEREETEGRPLGRGTLTTAISAEAEELGHFAGAAYSEPVVQIGTLVSVIAYISSTQPMLGLVALSMIVPQIAIVLISQRQVNLFVAARVRALRAATDQVSVERVREVTDEVMTRFDEIYDTRRRMFIWKMSAKFLLSAINGLGTVGVLMLGGWLVLEGQTDVGTVVAATTGLTRIQGPTTFLIAFYRQVSANRIKFDLLRELIAPQPDPAK